MFNWSWEDLETEHGKGVTFGSIHRFVGRGHADTWKAEGRREGGVEVVRVTSGNVAAVLDEVVLGKQYGRGHGHAWT